MNYWNRHHHLVGLFSLLVVLSLSASPSLAQACPAIVERALAAVDQFCQGAGRNQACYGNVALEATAQAGVSDFRFENVGDIVNVSDIQSLVLSGMNEAEGKWGVALMRLQANLPDTFPGQGVTFLLFGDVTLEDVSAEGQNPMQAFILKTGIGDAPCQEAPSSGLIVQTPVGAGQIALTVNGVDISMGSTVLFRSKAGEEMTVSTLEGAAVAVVDNVAYPIVAGSWIRTPMTEDGAVADAPALPVPYRAEPLQSLPISALDRDIEVRYPLDSNELARLHERLKLGEMPCGEVGFPDCSRFPRPETLLEQGWRLANEEDYGAPLPPPILPVFTAAPLPSETPLPPPTQVLRPAGVATRIVPTSLPANTVGAGTIPSTGENSTGAGTTDANNGDANTGANNNPSPNDSNFRPTSDTSNLRPTTSPSLPTLDSGAIRDFTGRGIILPTLDPNLIRPIGGN